jgi:hypothetical protein
LRCRAGCVSGKRLRPSAAKGLSGNRERETRVELCPRCASETPPYSNSYSIANTHLDSDPKTIAYTNINSDGDSNSHSYCYIHSNACADGHSDSHGNSPSHSYTNPYSHGGCASFAWRD